MTNFRNGLKISLNEDLLQSMPERISVLSIGCGNEPDIIFKEIEALIETSGKIIDYLGIDLELPAIDTIKNQLEARLHNTYQDRYQLELLQGDINEKETQLAIDFKAKRFDLILLRHPAFFTSELEQSTKQILRMTIPSLLKKDGLLLVSLYVEKECVFFDATHTLDPTLLKVLFMNKICIKGSFANADRARSHEAFSDNYMYCYTNRLNTRDTPRKFYRIGDLSSETDPLKVKHYILDCVAKIGAENIDREKGIFSLQPEYADTLSQELFPDLIYRIYYLSHYQTLFLPSEHDRIQETILDKYKKLESRADPKDYNAIYQSIVGKKYNTALRQAASKNNAFTEKVIKLLLKFSFSLNLSPDEKNISNQLSAIDYAQKSQHSMLEELITFNTERLTKMTYQ